MAKTAGDLGGQLGAGRVIDPPGALPQLATRLDPSGPVRPFEFEVAVEELCLELNSLREIRESAGGDRRRMSARVADIVAARGKLHNPETDSGGVLVGTVTAVGERFHAPPEVGECIITLGSLTVTPLRLETVARVDPISPLVEARGTAYVFDRAAWAPVPEDLPLTAALEIYDVCAGASHVRALAPPDGTICVLGAGRAGKLAMAAARDSAPAATVVAVDLDPDAIELAREFGLCDVGVTADLRDPVATLEAVRGAGAAPARLTVFTANARRCEATALLLTADDGTVLFFSMAASFSAAALAADGIGSCARMVIGSDYSSDCGAYALELVRTSKRLRGALEIPVPAPF